MSLSKEARIGLLVSIAIIVFFAGFYFLKGSNLLSGEHEYYAYYENVQGLQASSPILIKGMQVGRVSDIHLDENGKVKVTLAVKKKMNIPKATVANLISTDLLGTKGISLELSNSSQLAENEETLPSAIEGGIIDAVSAEITPLLQDLRHAVGTLDTLLQGVNGVLDDKAKANLQASLANLDVTTRNFSQLSGKLNGESDRLASVIRNADDITGNLARNNARVENILKYTELTTEQLSRAQIEPTLAELKTTANQLQGIMTKINSNEGSLGLLVNDKGLYTNLQATLQSANSLLADVEQHPTRYINVTIFGRKKQAQ
ncbi:MAG TPA: MlaD family protein [Flavipsychrobacter sp.]|nr:MlaD family protein [Flavipsychrobacter sp.]